MRKLRRCIWAEEYDAVARVVLSIGSSDLCGDMTRAIAQECLEVNSTAPFSCLLRILRLNDTPPKHSVELFRMVEPWFRSKCPGAWEWNVVIYSLVLDNRLEEALQILQAMETGEDERLPEPDEASYCILIPFVADIRGVSAAASLLTRMAKRGIVPGSICYLMMVVACNRSNPPEIDMAKLYMRKGEDFMRLEVTGAKFERIYDPSYLYNTMMAGYARVGRLEDSFTILGSMRQAGIRPGPVTFQIMQHACRFHADAAQEIRQLLRVMDQMGVEPETANYNTLIASYAATGQLTSALSVANRMRESGILWDRWTYSHLINAVVTSEQVELALRLLAKMRKDGVRPGPEHYTIAFVGLARAGYYEDAARVFRRMLTIGGIANQYSYNMMIGVNCQRADMVAALEVRDGMEQAGFAADIMTFRMLLEGYNAQTDYNSTLDLQDPLAALREKLNRVLLDGASMPAARVLAQEQLGNWQGWMKAYYLLIDAAVYNGEWPRAVLILEELVENGLPINYAKHARLLQDAKSSVRFGSLQEYKGTRSAVPVEAWSDADEEQKQALRAQEKWSSQVPNVQVGIVPSVGAAGVATFSGPGMAMTRRDLEGTVRIPPHVFSAHFYPGWLDGGRASAEEESADPAEIFHRMLDEFQEEEEEEVEAYEFEDEEDEDDDSDERSRKASREAYRILYAYHHETVHRRPLVSISLNLNRPLVGRVASESIKSLKKLFDTFGRPRSGPRAPVFVFMRPASASLEALLLMMAGAAAFPDSVFLLRSEDSAGVAALAQQCRDRNDRPLSFSLASMLSGLPAAALVNTRLLIANGEDVMATSCYDFDEALRVSLVDEHDRSQGELQVAVEQSQGLAVEQDETEESDRRPVPAPAPAPTGSKPSVWAAWLKRQCLHQLIRHDGRKLRLDGLVHRPALSEAELFRARGTQNGQVSVDLWLEEEKGEKGIASFFAGF
ncbi:unnamed protein product [Polarella glacialis]|uniref:Pentacotripeptide-repeat region of PRORP domain-containing protein n=1 Tax=Polarella glacialis TaxID=89957 RepID=A0A813IH50_POLGL|nr:unnamed protein product [Polarella glacialis]